MEGWWEVVLFILKGAPYLVAIPGQGTVCGQLKELQVKENEYVKEGQVLGYIAEPTKYYSVEGANIFFELTHEDKAIDPLNQMK